MKRLIKLAVVASAVFAHGANPPVACDAKCACEATHFVNDICLPSTLWMLSDTQNDIFVQPFLKRWRPYDDFVRFGVARECKMKFMRRLNHVASIDKPVDDTVLTTALVNSDDFKTVKTIRSKILVGKKGTGDKDVYAQIIGDSFTHGQFYHDALVTSGAVPKLHLVGLLKGRDGHFNEGRGGAALSTYFNVPTRAVQFYHGFQQPDGYRYWGAREFWVMAWRCVRKTQPAGFEPTYSCSRYDECVVRFDEKTGVLKSPANGDLQYDNSLKSFVAWNGTEWTKVDAKSLKWKFDYGKYLEMWNVKKPQFLFVMLGLNDFRNNYHADFANWGNQITAVKESYLAAVPDGKFAICIPCSTCGTVDNAAGDFTVQQNAAMWRFRDWLIKNFDNRQSEGFYLVDTGIGTDNEWGYRRAKGNIAKPFASYDGDDILNVQTGNPHPYPNYPTMGNPLAAFIQYYR